MDFIRSLSNRRRKTNKKKPGKASQFVERFDLITAKYPPDWPRPASERVKKHFSLLKHQ